jgi:Uma2 family endonuclease
MSTGFLIELEQGEVVVPSEVTINLSAFRQWATSDDFPQSGRIDYIAGHIEVSEMAGEDLLTHGSVKMEIARGIANEVHRQSLGFAFVDRARVSVPNANVSAEPDVVVLSFDAIESGRSLLIPKANQEAGRFVEIEGPPDLIVEVVSDSTVRKDTIRLPRAYFNAGVAEYWLADGRKEQLTFVIYQRGETDFEPVVADDDGFQVSAILGRAFRLDRSRNRLGSWQYELVSK